MEIYRENGGYRAIKTRVPGDAGGQVENLWNEGMDECISREENGERGVVSVVENHPSRRGDAVTSVSSLRPPLFSLSLPLSPSTVLAYPEQVTNEGHGITSRKLHPRHHPFLPRECASPKLLDYTSAKPSTEQNTALPFAKTKRSTNESGNIKNINCRLAF